MLVVHGGAWAIPDSRVGKFPPTILLETNVVSNKSLLSKTLD